MSLGQIFTALHPCEHSRINILQWILTKLGTYLDLKRIWNPIDFQGQRSRSQGLIFRQGDMPRFALPLLIFIHTEHTFCICPFLVTFFLATIDDRNLIFGHKLHIGTPYRGKRFFTRQIPTSCLPKSGGIISELSSQFILFDLYLH